MRIEEQKEKLERTNHNSICDLRSVAPAKQYNKQIRAEKAAAAKLRATATTTM